MINEKGKLFESELKLMELLWENEGLSAKELSLLANEKIAWNKNTTYTVIKKLIAKGVIKRVEPDFRCYSLVNRVDVGRQEAKSVIDLFYGGSIKALLSSFMADTDLSEEEVEELRQLIKESQNKE